MALAHTYVYRDPAVSYGGDTVVCVVDRTVADEYLGADQVGALFGGYAIYTTMTGQDFIGVWGRRNAARFRRFLRERGVEVIIRRGRPLGLRLRSSCTHPGSRPSVRAL